MFQLTVGQIKLPLDHTEEHIVEEVCKRLRTKPKDIQSWRIKKKSYDARRGVQIVYTIEVALSKKIQVNNKSVMLAKEKQYLFPTGQNLKKNPIIIGSGPAGLFCALILAENGYEPIVLERGKKVEERIKDVNHFFSDKVLLANSNIQFGEGGAGTFSDGKINTGVKDRDGRKEKILDEFIEAGAPEEIRYLSRPHIGTDYLVKVVKDIRNKIEKLGGRVYFETTVTDLIIENDQIIGVETENKDIFLTDHVVLAIGHSARDTFEMIEKKPIEIEQKAFAIGLRIEHPQEMIDKNQYGNSYPHPKLPAADYKLTHRTKSGRGVYSFCMCPGGFVVNASSEKGQVVCNGMSNFKRDEVNANSAIIVNVTPKDFQGDHPLAGMYFQRNWEKKAYELGHSSYALPVQLFKDFCKDRVSVELGDIVPNQKSDFVLSNLNACLPPYVSDAIKEGIFTFGKKIKGFSREDSVLTGVETRSSSPIRIVRDERFESNIKGLFPCGEGAGYAGGIMSAAIDGIKVAEKMVL